MSDLELLRAAAARVRELDAAATPGPWSYDSYSTVFSSPRSHTYDEWADPLIDAGHELNRYGVCPACGDWREQPSGRSPGLGDGCAYFRELYHVRESRVAFVPAIGGDLAEGCPRWDAELIAAFRAVAEPLADLLAALVEPARDLQAIEELLPPEVADAALAVARALLPTPATDSAGAS